MTVPSPVSGPCERRACHDCPGTAWDWLRDLITGCRHDCHQPPTRRGRP